MTIAAAAVAILLIAVVVLAIGFGVGMLVARPLARWLNRDDEEPHDV
jgi:type IV secretory pathway TrbD component